MQVNKQAKPTPVGKRHPAMGSRTLVDDGARGVNLARRYEEEAMMRMSVMMVDDSNREALFRRRRDGAMLARYSSCQLICGRGFYVEDRWTNLIENGILGSTTLHGAHLPGPFSNKNKRGSCYKLDAV
jgi:hypothetical protein